MLGQQVVGLLKWGVVLADALSLAICNRACAVQLLRRNSGSFSNALPVAAGGSDLPACPNAQAPACGDCTQMDLSHAMSSSHPHEQAARVKARQLMLSYAPVLQDASKDEIHWLKEMGVLGKRAPKSSLMAAEEVLELLRHNQRADLAALLCTALERFYSKRGARNASTAAAAAANQAFMRDEYSGELRGDPPAAFVLFPVARHTDPSDDGNESDAEDGGDDVQDESYEPSLHSHRKKAHASTASSRTSNRSRAVQPKRKFVTDRSTHSLSRSHFLPEVPTTSVSVALCSRAKRSRRDKSVATLRRSAGVSPAFTSHSCITGRQEDQSDDVSPPSFLAPSTVPAEVVARLQPLASCFLYRNPKDALTPTHSALLSPGLGTAVRIGCDHSPTISVSSDGTMFMAPLRGSGSVRATHGLVQGVWYIEVRGCTMLRDGRSATDHKNEAASAVSVAARNPDVQPHCRVGFATVDSNLDKLLGSDSQSYAYGDRFGDRIHHGEARLYADAFGLLTDDSTATPSSASELRSRHSASPTSLSSTEAPHRGDVVGMLIELDVSTPPLATVAHTASTLRFSSHRITFFKNGVCQGVAFEDVPAGVALFPAASLSNGMALRFDFQVAERAQLRHQPPFAISHELTHTHDQHTAMLPRGMFDTAPFRTQQWSPPLPIAHSSHVPSMQQQQQQQHQSSPQHAIRSPTSQQPLHVSSLLNVHHRAARSRNLGTLLPVQLRGGRFDSIIRNTHSVPAPCMVPLLSQMEVEQEEAAARRAEHPVADMLSRFLLTASFSHADHEAAVFDGLAAGRSVDVGMVGSVPPPSSLASMVSTASTGSFSSSALRHFTDILAEITQQPLEEQQRHLQQLHEQVEQRIHQGKCLLRSLLFTTLNSSEQTQQLQAQRRGTHNQASVQTGGTLAAHSNDALSPAVAPISMPAAAHELQHSQQQQQWMHHRQKLQQRQLMVHAHQQTDAGQRELPSIQQQRAQLQQATPVAQMRIAHVGQTAHRASAPLLTNSSILSMPSLDASNSKQLPSSMQSPELQMASAVSNALLPSSNALPASLRINSTSALLPLHSNTPSLAVPSTHLMLQVTPIASPLPFDLQLDHASPLVLPAASGALVMPPPDGTETRVADDVGDTSAPGATDYISDNAWW